MRGPYLTAESLHEIREAVATRAAQQGQVFRREHLPAWGVDPEVVRSMLRRAWWVRLRYGVYSDRAAVVRCRSDPWAGHLLDAAGALMTLREPAFAFGLTSAAVHRLPTPVRPPARISILRHLGADVRAGHERSKNAGRLPDAIVRTRAIDLSDCSTIAGIPVVPRALAAFSAAAECSLEWAVVLLDAGAWQDEAVLQRYEELLDVWPTLKGIGTVRRACALASCGAQSPLESSSRFRLMARGIPAPLLQHAFHDARGLIGYADMYWPEWGIVGECDGLGKYQTREDLIAEKLREDRLRALGLVVVRWTWHEIMNDPDAVVRRILNARSLRRRHAG